jgi:hypothetical protein
MKKIVKVVNYRSGRRFGSFLELSHWPAKDSEALHGSKKEGNVLMSTERNL